MNDRSLALHTVLCYAPPDRERIVDLYEKLSADGIIPWFDEEWILPGQNVREESTAAIKSADVVLICLSQHTATSWR